jgi:hypothetical protein
MVSKGRLRMWFGSGVYTVLLFCSGVSRRRWQFTRVGCRFGDRFHVEYNDQYKQAHELDIRT